MIADLHLHTTESDGTWSPVEVVRKAIEIGLSAIAITDHDTTSGIEAAIETAGDDLEVIPGIEFSTASSNGEEVHILGLWIDAEFAELQDRLLFFRESRVKRNRKILERLNDQGIDISQEDVLRYVHEDIYSRSHIASVLVEKDIVKTKGEAFEKFLAQGAPAYAERPKLLPQEAIELIKRAGGVPVLAHPGLLKDLNIVPSLVQAGLVGLEVIHSAHTKKQTKFFLEFAKNHNLLPSGGSDCHGPKGKDEVYIGHFTIPITWKEDLFKKSKNH